MRQHLSHPSSGIAAAPGGLSEGLGPGVCRRHQGPPDRPGPCMASGRCLETDSPTGLWVLLSLAPETREGTLSLDLLTVCSTPSGIMACGRPGSVTSMPLRHLQHTAGSPCGGDPAHPCGWAQSSPSLAQLVALVLRGSSHSEAEDGLGPQGFLGDS